MNRRLRLGTRGSRLALVQAETVRSALLDRHEGWSVEIVVIRTKGDRILDSPLSMIGDKGLFIREIEEALLEDRIDLAVHSLKDLPTSLPRELELAGVLRREDPRDALVTPDGRPLSELKAGDRVGTSSLRRRAQLLAAVPGLRIVDIRGNVDTRLEKLDSGHCEALVLAACGLERLGLSARIAERLDTEILLPAVCQGIIAVETRRGDRRTGERIDRVSDPLTLSVASAERAFLHRLEGGCQVPIGCLCTIEDGQCSVTGLVADLDGRRLLRRTARGPAGEAPGLAEGLAGTMLEQGGAEILESIRPVRSGDGD